MKTKTETKLHTQTKLLYALFITATLAAIVLFLPTKGEEQIYHHTFRVHILASSDAPCDQALKYTLRDRLMPDVYALVANCTTTEEAEQVLKHNRNYINQTANQILCAEGYTGGVSTEIGNFRYDRRSLEGAIYPAGVYPSLRVIIGEGEGKNWWSVLFPAMSVYVSSDASGEVLTNPNFSIDKENLSFRFRTLEWLSLWFDKE